MRAKLKIRMLSGLGSTWQRVRGHALRQALGATLFATYTVILFRVWPDSKTWPDAHNFYRRQWVEGMLWCAFSKAGRQGTPARSHWSLHAQYPRPT